jgi:S1-C subfamily serine protease
MKLFFAIVLACLVLLLTGVAQPSSQSTHQTMENTTVIVNQIGQGTDMWGRQFSARGICTGVVAAVNGTDELIVTARHCVDTAVERNPDGSVESTIHVIPQNVVFFDGDVGRIMDVAAYGQADLGVLMVHSMRRHEAATFDGRHIAPDSPATVLGMPLGKFWTFSGAQLTGAMQTVDPGSGPFDAMVAVCDTCNRGDSGGGIYNSQGFVVGILSAMDDVGDVYAVPASVVVQFLRDYVSAH